GEKLAAGPREAGPAIGRGKSWRQAQERPGLPQAGGKAGGRPRGQACHRPGGKGWRQAKRGQACHRPGGKLAAGQEARPVTD
ncbi:MAG: hypothetical protein LIP16_20380, partial [Clostridium sp.]|nr:hypothetical protein [Clostridium sp.]